MSNGSNVEMEFVRGLELVKKYGPYTMQYKDDSGEWLNVGNLFHGIDAAYEALNAKKAEVGDADAGRYRVIPKNEADKLREGIKIGMSLKARKWRGKV